MALPKRSAHVALGLAGRIGTRSALAGTETLRLRPMGRDFMRGATPRLLWLRCDAYCRMYEKDGCSVRLLHPQRWHDPLHRMLSERAVGSGSFHARLHPTVCSGGPALLSAGSCTPHARLPAQPSRCCATTSSIRQTRRNIPRAPRPAWHRNRPQPVPAQMWVGQSRRRCGWASPGADVDHRCKSAHFVYPNRSRSQRGNRRSADSGEVLEDSCRV